MIEKVFTAVHRLIAVCVVSANIRIFHSILPQRHRFAEFSAVAAMSFPHNRRHRRSGRHCPAASSPQRQQIPLFGAVAVMTFPHNRCHKRSGRHCLTTPLPQRQQILRNTAVAVMTFLHNRCHRRSGRHCLTVPEFIQYLFESRVFSELTNSFTNTEGKRLSYNTNVLVLALVIAT